MNDNTVLFTATAFEANNIWSVRIAADGALQDEPHHWSGGTASELYPYAVVTSPGQIHAVYAALSITNSIWRIPLNAEGRRGGDPELLTRMYRAGSPSLSRDGRTLVFSTKATHGETIQRADLGTQPPVRQRCTSGPSPDLS
ncbi:MAG: hypothetical protein WDO73_06640 [Ignavibacteriota bacterium]